MIKGQAAIYTGNTEEARETYKYFAPGLQATDAPARRADPRPGGAEPLPGRGLDTALGAIAERRDDLAALTSNANQALGAIADRNEELDRTLVALPPAMRQANTTFVNLRAALDDLDPLIADLGEVAPDLPAVPAQTRQDRRPGVPVFRDLRQALAQARARQRPHRLAARRCRAASARPARSVHADDRRRSTPPSTSIDFARPYSPDLLGFVEQARPGHRPTTTPTATTPACCPPSANLFAYNEATGELDPIPPAEQFDAVPGARARPVHPLPGRLRPRPTPAGRARPTTRSSTTASLDGDCDPDDVPPGP